ncbi:MAG: GTPase HflX [Fimbriimonadaceae bacterium]|nr:GTPase HflX [Fimbriimonadaceae bacterium]
MSQKLHQVNTEEKERLFLVYVNPDEGEDSLVEQELEGLADAAGGEIAGSLRQRVERPTKGTYIGSGKVIELEAAAAETQADSVVFDCELSGIQIRNLEEAVKKRVIDRTQLILDIFAGRARTREGRLQVELAQYSYMMPRLMSVYTKFERQRGGIGMRGPGETKLESDRRMVRDRISKLKEEIEQVKRHRRLQRESRRQLPHPFVAIVGYTSAGKSTLMNRICDTDLLADAMPFATLDPTTRKVDLPDGDAFFLSDTVGFIRNLPTLLVAAFRGTLEEVGASDLLLHVVDVSHPEWEAQVDAVHETIEELQADDIPTITVFNKVDALDDRPALTALIAEWPNAVAISAATGEGVPDLLEAIRKHLTGRLLRIQALVPYADAQLAENAHRYGRVDAKDYREDGIYLDAWLTADQAGRLQPYAVSE